MLWGTSAFVYVVIFTRISTEALASSQIVTTIENFFTVAASGLAPAAVATVGQALGTDATRNAQQQAKRVLRAAIVAGFIFTVILLGVSFLLPPLYPRVDKSVLNLAFWGILIVAAVQPAKVVNNVLGTGILPSDGDTKFVFLSHVLSSYAIGLPVAALTETPAALMQTHQLRQVPPEGKPPLGRSRDRSTSRDTLGLRRN